MVTASIGNATAIFTSPESIILTLGVLAIAGYVAYKYVQRQDSKVIQGK
jgi:hypothetical protein